MLIIVDNIREEGKFVYPKYLSYYFVVGVMAAGLVRLIARRQGSMTGIIHLTI